MSDVPLCSGTSLIIDRLTKSGKYFTCIGSDNGSPKGLPGGNDGINSETKLTFVVVGH